MATKEATEARRRRPRRACLEPVEALLRGRREAHQARARPLLPGGRAAARCAASAIGRSCSSASSTASTARPFYQKRAPEKRPEWMRTVTLSFPVGPHRRGGRGRRRGRARLDRRTSAASSCIRTRCAPTISSTPTSCASISIRCPASRGTTVREVALEVQARCSTSSACVGWPKTSGSRGMHVNVRIAAALDVRPRCGARRWRSSREVERRAPTLATQQVVEGGAPRRLPRLQPERQGSHDLLGLLGAPAARRARLDAACVGRGGRAAIRRTSRC